MPDPHKDLAEIIEPATQAAAGSGSDYLLPLALACVVLVLGLAWFWRRRAPLRALRRLARAAEVQAGADALARLLENRAAPAAWRRELDRLRFARQEPDAAEMLERLCREAEGFLRARGGNK